MEDPDDAFEPGQLYEEECPHCGKTFVFEVDYTRDYYTKQAVCLNGGEHDYQKTRTFPPEAARLKCSMCGDEKPLE